MSDDSATPRYELPEQHPEYPHPGEPSRRAPHQDGGALPTVTDETVIEQTRQLFCVARHPRADAMWRHLKPRLLTKEARLMRDLRDDPTDPVTASQLQEVRRFLGRS